MQGVSSQIKYLTYVFLSLGKKIFIFSSVKETTKVKNFMIQCNIANTYTKITDFKEESQCLCTCIHYIVNYAIIVIDTL